jgi:DNA sulfur modification protein DndD
VDPTGGAKIELCFRHVNDGEEQSYRVVRHWHANGNGIKEGVEVEVNGVHDPTVAESWAEYAEEFVPSRLAHLFFFDGEKIETLADLANAADVLRIGIHSLLGLDLVERLQDDLDVVATRKEKLLQVDDTTTLALKNSEDEVRQLRSRREELLQSIAGHQSQLEQVAYHLERVTERLHAEGGELFAQKDLLENDRTTLLTNLEGIDIALREVASGGAPLLLVSNLLGTVQQQARKEKAGAQAGILDDILRERDVRLLSTFGELGISKSVKATIESFLATDRREYTSARDLPRYLQLSDEAVSLLQDLSRVTLPGTRQKITSLLARRKELAHALTSVERKLSTVPEEDAIAPFEREREELATKRSALEENLARLREERQRAEHELSRKEATLKRLQEEAARVALEQEDLTRMIGHARRSQRTLCLFRDRIVEQHLSRIETSVQESFRHLLRKQTLVSSLHIDQGSYTLELRNAEGIVISPERLSAGERQLLAVSLVWGLARASHRPLPAVIDTPLGRLDSSHRRHLVERYFPKASHQVLLLSTDEEIRDEYLEALRPAIGHSYLLQYDEQVGSSIVKCGYFGKEDGVAA